jgi:hypothetical protein
MDTVKLPKFKWGELSELNSGHTKNEWGLQKKQSAPVILYTVSWDDYVLCSIILFSGTELM